MNSQFDLPNTWSLTENLFQLLPETKCTAKWRSRHQWYLH